MTNDAKDRDPSVAAAIAAQLRDAIVAGELVSDERLPGEQELAERYGVSRPTVREALKRLAAQNLIRRFWLEKGEGAPARLSRLAGGAR